MKKGFTLIELLAVIVILAIIALIATPIILGIINDAREESNKRSTELYAKGLELAIARKNLTEEFNPGYCKIEAGIARCGKSKDSELNELPVDVEGKDKIFGEITLSNGKIENNELYVKADNTTEPATFNFSIDYICLGKESIEYTAEEGMTWQDWINSYKISSSSNDIVEIKPDTNEVYIIDPPDIGNGQYSNGVVSTSDTHQKASDVITPQTYRTNGPC